MGLHPLDYAVLLLYFVVVTIIGVIATRLVRNREDYVMGGRRFGKIMMIMFAFGAGTHSESAVGVAAQSYRYGLAGIWYQWVMVFTLPIYWLLAPIFRRARVLTTADFFERRFGSLMMYVYSFFALFVMISYNGVMFFSSGKVVEALTGGAIPLHVSIIAMALVSFTYGVAGGLVAAVWNDFLQGLLTIVMSLLLIPFFWVQIGGLEGFQAALMKSGHPNSGNIFSLVLATEMTIFWIVMMSFNQLINMVAQPQIMASTAAGKSEMDGRVGFVGGMILKRLMTVPWALTGVMAIAMYGSTSEIDPDHIFGRMSADLLPAGCVGLMLAGVMASVMDNCAVNMLSFAGIYTNSIHQRLIDRSASERRLLWINRVSSVVFGIVSLGISFLFSDVTSAMRFIWQTVPLMGIAWFFAILWRRANRWGALASFVGAASATAYAKFVLGWEGDAGLPATIVLYLVCGTAAGILVSLVTPPESPERTEHFFLLLNTPIGQEQVLRNAGFRQTPGNDTFEFPPPRVSVEEHDHAVRIDDSPPEVQTIYSKINGRQSQHEATVGFFVLVLVVIAMLGGVLALAKWLTP